jgi:TRAP-type C4-dicarboxylate transport system substrate-binding protein
MKKAILCAAIFWACLVSLITNPALPAQAASTTVYEFNLSNYHHAASPIARFIEQWADKVNKDSNGRIKIRVFHGAVLLPPNNTWPGVAKGVADLGCSYRYESFGKTFQEYIGDFLIGAPSGRVVQQIQYEAYDKFPELRAEWKDNKVILFATSPRTNIHNNVRPLRIPADLKGLQIRVTVGGAAEVIKTWGGIPVFAPITESYEMLQKKVVQGIMAGSDVLKTFRLAEVCNYTINLAAQYHPHFFLCMNWDKFNSLPPDLQKVIDDSMPWARQNAQKALDDQEPDGIKFAQDLGKGHQFYDPTPEELAQWVDPIKPLLEKWAGSVDAKGLPGTALYNFVRERVKAYSK